jgi:hypothetical protein
MAGTPSGGNGTVHVPQYDIYGHMHHRKPFKDKAYLQKEDIRHPRWLEQPPFIRTRTDLIEAQARGRVPDLTYDFDGDGVVGSNDHFVGRHFDQGNKGTLTTQERQDAKQALKEGFMDKFMTGLDSTGQVHRATFLQQRRGVILTHDNVASQSGKTHVAHPDHDKIPLHATRTALGLDRWADRKGHAQEVGERFAEAMKPVLEPEPPNARTIPRTCSFTNIRQRGEGWTRESRARGGLEPDNTLVNPEREAKIVAGERVEGPLFASRSQLLETRKEIMRQEAEDLRAKGDEVHVPHSVRKARKHAEEFEFRRPGQEPKTFTAIKNARRQEKIEYDMANFNYPTQPKYPRFSDRPDVPFWVDENATQGAAPHHSEMLKSLSEPTLKVTHIPFGHEERQPTAEPASHTAGLPVKGGPSEEMGSNTVKRWSTDMLERGQGRNKPRLFDSIQPIRIGPRDLESLDLTSSMEPVRTAALRRRAEEQKRSTMNPRRSCLWTNASQFSATTDSQMDRSGYAADRSFGDPSGAKSRDLSMQKAGGGGAAGGDAKKDASQATVAPGQLATRVLATNLPDKTIVHEHPREPRFYGATKTAPPPPDATQAHPSPPVHAATTPGIGIRSGGFQRLDWPPRQKHASGNVSQANPAPVAAA